MAKLDPRSADAIRLYMLLGAAVTGFLTAYFLVVPILKNTCTWFTARCTQVLVQRGANNALLVTVGPYQYYYDGVNYIFAYGDALVGTCPAQVVSGVQPYPVVSPALPNFCFRFKPTPDDPACVAGDESKCAVCAEPAVKTCVRAAAPVADGKFTCDGTTLLDTQTCCDFLPPCPGTQQCVLSEAATRSADGTLSCSTGTLDGNVCDFTPRYVAGQGYTCNGGQTFSTTPHCCKCSDAFQQVTNAGTTDAVDIFEPTFVVDAQSMKLVPTNGGIVCGVKQSIVAQMFAGKKREVMNLNVPVQEAGLNVYQVFDVLRQQGVLRVAQKKQGGK